MDRFRVLALRRDGRQKELSVVIILLEVLTFIQVFQRRRVFHIGHAFVVGEIVAVVVIRRMQMSGDPETMSECFLIFFVIRTEMLGAGPPSAGGAVFRNRRRIPESISGQLGLLQNVLLQWQEMRLGFRVQVVVVIDIGVERNRVVNGSTGRFRNAGCVRGGRRRIARGVSSCGGRR